MTVATSPPMAPTTTTPTIALSTTAVTCVAAGSAQPATMVVPFAATAATLTTAPTPTMTTTPTPTPATPTMPTKSTMPTTASHIQRPTPTMTTILPSTNALTRQRLDEVPANATCVEFLHLMKAFSESAVNVTEMAQRVDSLVHQDEQLLRLLPLTPDAVAYHAVATDELLTSSSRVSTSSSRGSSSGSVADTTDDETSSAHGIDVEAMAAAMELSMAEGMKKWHDEVRNHDDDVDLDMEVDVDLDVGEDDSDEGFLSDDMDVDDDMDDMDDDDDSMDDDSIDDGASTDADTRSSSQPRIGSLGDDDDDEDDEDQAALHERRAQEDLQRWMELELDLDCTEDPYDVSLHLPGVGSTLHSAPPATSSTTATAHVNSTTGTMIPSVADAALGVHATLATATGSHANSSSVLSTTAAMTNKSRFRSALFDRKSVTAALFEDDDDDDDATDLVLMNALLRKKTEVPKPSSLVGAKRALDQETKSDDDAHGGTIWGMEVDSYEQDLLSSIDHSVLCDRENRFLQWDLEIEAATAAAVAAAAVSHKTELRTPPSSVSASGSAFASASAEARQKLMMASSPRDHKLNQPLRSPSNVDTSFVAEDWSSLDFGTFQNRTVSHILSSCLHKRKLHHPYKDRVTLVNFNVPGGEPIGPVPSHTAMPAPTGSLLFGAGLEAADVLLKNGGASAVTGLLSSASLDMKHAKLAKSGEKKAKKPRVDGERKKLSSKLDPFDFDGTSDDLVGHAGFAAKLAMTKLENLPLPDLTNLPQDLKELKRKIEATEHKVEGTKHRHRKGGPCPRCQVQNQLRAAKRAYHKRAVAHKKLPQLGTVSPALTATAVVMTPPPSTVVAAPVVMAPSSTVAAKPLVPTFVPGSVTAAAEAVKAATLKATSAAVATTAAASTAVPAVVGAPASVVRPATVPTTQPSAATSVPLAPAKMATAVASTNNAPAKLPVPSATTGLPPAVTASPFPRRSCGENALTSPFSSPSSVPTSSSSPSSPESASPPVHHVTVTSA